MIGKERHMWNIKFPMGRRGLLGRYIYKLLKDIIIKKFSSQEEKWMESKQRQKGVPGREDRAQGR
jgi:hypothetical protein